MAITIYKTKKGEPRYKAIVWLKHRQLESKSFRRKVDAQEWHRKRLSYYQDQKLERLRGDKMSLDEFFEQVYWPNMRISVGTAEDYLRIHKTWISPRFGNRTLSDISESEWAEHISRLVSKGMSRARANRVHTAISAVYGLAVKLRYVTRNPLMAVEWYKEDIHPMDYWSESEAQKLLSSAYSSGNPRFPFYQTAYETGMRASELLALQRDCINLKDGFIEIRRKTCRKAKSIDSTTKTGHKRMIPIGVGLKSTLQKQLESHSNAFVFIQPNGRPYTYDYIIRNFRRDQKAIGVKVLGLHGVRHTFASHFMMRNGNIYDLAAILGHSDIETTKRYAHLSQEHLRRKVDIVKFELPTNAQVISLHPTGCSHIAVMEPVTGMKATALHSPQPL